MIVVFVFVVSGVPGTIWIHQFHDWIDDDDDDVVFVFAFLNVIISYVGDYQYTRT